MLHLLNNKKISSKPDFRFSILHSKSHVIAFLARADHSFYDPISIFKVELAEDELIEPDEFFFIIELGSLNEFSEPMLVLRVLNWVSVVGNSLRHWVAKLLTLLLSSQAVGGELRARCLKKK